MVAGNVIEVFDRSSSVLRFDDGSVHGAHELADDGRRIARCLRDVGIEVGDRVAIHLPNGIDYVRLLLACAAGRFVAVSVNTRYSDHEVADLVRRTGARFVVLPDRWDEAEPETTRARPDDPFVVFTTSGTTGRPKMVVHSQRSIAVHAFEAAAAFRYGPADTVMAVMPLCGTFGLATLMAAVAGDCAVVVTDFDLARTGDLIGRHAVTAVNGSDDMFHRLIESGAALRSIRLAGIARFNTSLDRVVVDADHVGATLTGLYGMSEVQALFSLRDPELDAADRLRPGGTLVSPNAGYRIVDGELEVRGPSLMLGYLAEGGDSIDDELTADHVADGWFRTGDLARAEDDRTFEFLARRADVLRLGGFLVDPTEIESVITTMPGVIGAQVVAVARPGGTRPVAFVIGDFDEAAVIELCRRELATYKTPICVFGVEQFPTTPSANGTKVRRAELRDLAVALLAADS